MAKKKKTEEVALSSKEGVTSDAEPKKMHSEITDALRAIKTKFGEDSIMTLGDKPHVNVDAIPAGSLGVDWALGVADAAAVVRRHGDPHSLLVPRYALTESRDDPGHLVPEGER